MLNKIKIDRSAWILVAICALVMIPFLGLADFNTKGEPREAVVAYSILDSGNWILPTNNGGEIPYKPPFFHWCIAAVSLLNGGVVNEFTSRLPSAIALIAMTVWTYVFVAKRREPLTGLATALIAFTTFEFHRAGANCRVDMVLTAATVGAIYSLYTWWERGMKGVPWLGILMMSIGTLTKGPVGTLIPCLVVGIFLLLRGVNFFRAFFSLTAWALMSLVLPLAWYVAAYGQGGQEFLNLVLEENFGRMTSTMSYESCVNPWPYNIVTLVAGFVPWTLAVLMVVFVLPYRSYKRSPAADSWRELFRMCRTMPSVNLLATVAAATIFVFYCIPQSKRSVYLMPMYPFVAYYVAKLLIYVSRNKISVVKVFGDIMAAIAGLLFVCFIAIRAGMVPDSLFGTGRHAAQNIAMMHAIGDLSGFWAWLWMLVSPAAAVIWWTKWRKKCDVSTIVPAISGIIIAIYLSMAGAYQPAVLNVKSVKGITAEINRIAPQEEGELYEFISHGEFAAGDPIHYFQVDFYIGDRMASFYKRKPESGFLLIGDRDAEQYFPQFEAEGYVFEERYASPRKMLDQMPRLYKFYRR
ncbi:MAG: glycosyltransferase family 39 protein [Muribaculaceae bacterium]|nr:glycosyltransferase family 39 protein [Muribaculaceae bacterium]